VRVQFVYQAGGEPACDPACDYGQLVYSMDGVNFTQLPGEASPPLYAQLTDANYDYVLPSQFNGKQFYLGFLWTNDANAGTSISITIDNFIITAKGRDIESELAATVSEKINAETGKPTYFYSTTDGQLMARVSNSTAHNYGCMSATLEKAGSSAFEFYVDGLDHHRVGDKIMRLTATTNNVSGAYTITTYFTETEIQAIEAFTGFTRTQLYMYRTTANPYTAANAANTERVSASYTAISGLGGTFTASFSTGFSAAFALGNMVTIPLPVNCVDFKAIKKDNYIQLAWKVNAEINNKSFEVERSTDGINYVTMGTVLAGTAANGNYSFTDYNLSGKRNYYRLKQTDVSGQSRYICTTLSVPLGNSNDFSLGHIFPNPSAGQAFVNIYTPDARKINIEYVNILGQVFNKHSIELQPGATRVALKLNGSAGNLLVRFRDEKGMMLGYRKITGL